MSVRGIFTSHSGLIAERQTDLSARVLMTGPGAMAPMLALSSGMPTQRAPNTAFSWIEDSHISGNQEVTTGGNAAATSLIVDDAGIWTTKTILMNEATGEYMLVTAINDDGKTITVIRGFSGTTAQTVDVGDTLQSVGTAFEEGGGKPDSISQKGEERINYTQIFKNGWSITGTAKSVDYVTGNQMAYNRSMCLNYHAEDIERAFIWGRKGLRVLNGKQLRTTNGLLAQIEQYGGIVEAATDGTTSGNYSLKLLQNFLRRIFDVQAKGMPNERIGYCGSGFLEIIQHMALLDGQYNITQGEERYGIKVTTIVGFNGQLKLITHPMMVENPKWSHELYVIHPGLIKKREKRGTWTEEFSPEKQNNAGVDATEGYIADEMGFEIRGAKTMGILTNVQTAVKSFN